MIGDKKEERVLFRIGVNEIRWNVGEIRSNIE
jgi:hypothetical protein